jgi:hypothetical protein
LRTGIRGLGGALIEVTAVGGFAFAVDLFHVSPS